MGLCLQPYRELAVEEEEEGPSAVCLRVTAGFCTSGLQDHLLLKHVQHSTPMHIFCLPRTGHQEAASVAIQAATCPSMLSAVNMCAAVLAPGTALHGLSDFHKVLP